VKILAFDTATEACSVALGLGERTIERYEELERGHAEQILPMIDAVLAQAGIALTQLDAIAFGRGPGGFTGLRLAASVAQGLAFGAGVGVVPVSDLAAVAARVRQLEPQARRVLVVNDARMREVYWAEYAIDSDLRPLGEERVAASSAVTFTPATGGGAWVAAGRGLIAWPELADRARAAGAILHPDLLPRAREVLELARPRVAAGQILEPAAALPVYVRDHVAVPQT
jgi:tRNA threonylcarbamoyladenosine biosynthesis protein TsaB